MEYKDIIHFNKGDIVINTQGIKFRIIYKTNDKVCVERLDTKTKHNTCNLMVRKYENNRINSK